MILNISSSQFTGQLTKGVVERVEDVGEVGWATIIPNSKQLRYSTRETRKEPKYNGYGEMK